MSYDAAAVSDTVIAHKKPITLQQGRALRDNPLAIAAGATGAPRIQPEAMDLYYGSGSASGSGTQTIITVTDLDNVSAVLASAMAYTVSATDNSSATTIRYSFSTDNGSTWGSETIWFSASASNGGSDTQYKSYVLPVSSSQNAVRLRYASSSSGGVSPSFSATASITGLQGV